MMTRDISIVNTQVCLFLCDRVSLVSVRVCVCVFIYDFM